MLLVLAVEVDHHRVEVVHQTLVIRCEPEGIHEPVERGVEVPIHQKATNRVRFPAKAVVRLHCEVLEETSVREIVRLSVPEQLRINFTVFRRTQLLAFDFVQLVFCNAGSLQQQHHIHVRFVSSHEGKDAIRVNDKRQVGSTPLHAAQRLYEGATSSRDVLHAHEAMQRVVVQVGI